MDLSSWQWLRDGRSPLADAGCVTAVAGTDADLVLESFGADPEPLAPGEVNWPGESPMVSVAQADDGVIAMEVNGFQGSREEVLRVVSKHGRAASIVWNVNA
jgi:hypothetical protein